MYVFITLSERQNLDGIASVMFQKIVRAVFVVWSGVFDIHSQVISLRFRYADEIYSNFIAIPREQERKFSQN